MKDEKRELGRIYTDEEIESQAKKDKEILAQRWAEAKEKLDKSCGAELADRIIFELKELYSIYKKETVVWYAELYDVEIGGYYYSNSARDNDEVLYERKKYKLLPDLESTCQAMGVVRNSGMADSFGGDIAKALPAWMKERTVPFVLNMQDEKNGYFYHPQWGRELTDKWPNRRGRDLNWAIKTLESYGEKPLYRSPFEERSEDKKSKGTETAPHLKDKEAFVKYLNSRGYDAANAYSSYLVGSIFESQIREIAARDKELEKEGADYRLLSILKEWFDQRFNKENGSWTTAPLCHDVCNGILKIGNTYARAGLELPDPIRSLETVLKCVTLEQKPLHICCILNPWYAVSTIMSSVRDSAVRDNSDEAAKSARAIRERAMSRMPQMIKKTAENLRLFQKPDGSFSYFADRSADRSQDLPVAIPRTNEGDMNATMICNVAVPNHICGFLGIPDIPIFTESDRMRYVTVLETKRMNKKSKEK